LARICIVNRNSNHAARVAGRLESCGYAAIIVSNGDEARSLAGAGSVEMVLYEVDVALEEGIDHLEQIREDFPDLPVVLAATYPPEDSETLAGKSSVSGMRGRHKRNDDAWSAPPGADLKSVKPAPPGGLRIALISPRSHGLYHRTPLFHNIYSLLHRELGILFEYHKPVPNLSLITLAATAPGHDYTLIQEDYQSIEEVESRLFKRHYDLALITALGTQARRGYAIADHLRKQGIPVVMGGLHASALPDEAAEHVDSLVIGEGEEIFPHLVADAARGRLARRYRATSPVDLGRVPVPRYDLIENFAAFDQIPIQVTRGCPHYCTYCCLKDIFGEGFRRKPIEQVVAEINTISAIHPGPFILTLTDENALADGRYARDLLCAFRELGVRWGAFCDIGVADDPELIEMLGPSGCIGLQVGLESLNRDNLEREAPWRVSYLPRYPQLIKRIQDAGLGITGLFVLGFDQDGPEVFDTVADFIKENNLWDVSLGPLFPFPGTRICNRLEAEGRLLTNDWSRNTWTYVNYRPARMTPSELQAGLLRLHRKVADRHSAEQRETHFRKVFKRIS